jgi:hypothetical protein
MPIASTSFEFWPEYSNLEMEDESARKTSFRESFSSVLVWKE